MAKKDIVFAEAPDIPPMVLYEGEPVRMSISRAYLEAMLKACGEASAVDTWVEKIDVTVDHRQVRCLMFHFTREPEARP